MRSSTATEIEAPVAEEATASARPRAHIGVPTLAVWLWFAVLIALRFPHLFHHGTLYAEEAVYFRVGYLKPWWDSVDDVRFGYISLVANVIGETTSHLPLGIVPSVTRLLAIIVGPGVVVAVINAVPASVLRRLAAVAVVVMTPLMNTEWATAIHAQFWLLVALIVSLAVPVDRPRRVVAQAVLAGLTVLSAAIAVLLTPVFAWRAWRERDRGSAIVAAVLTVGGLVQFSVSGGRRVTWRLDEYLAAVFTQDVLKGVFGSATQPIADVLARTWASPLTLVTVVAGLASVAGTSWWLVDRRFKVVVVAAAICGSGAMWFALPPYDSLFVAGYGGRYAVMATVPVLLALVLGGRVDSWPRLALCVVPVMVAVGTGYAEAKEVDATYAGRLDYWGESVARTPGLIRTNEACYYALVATVEPTPLDKLTWKADNLVVDVGPLIDDFESRAPWAAGDGAIFVSAGLYEGVRATWVDGGWLTNNGFEFGGDEGLCSVGTSVEMPSGLPVRGESVELPAALLRRRPERVTSLYVMYGSSFGEALAHRRWIPIPNDLLAPAGDGG